MTGRFLDDDDTLDPDDIDELLDDDATIFGEDVTILAPRATGQPLAEEKPEPPRESQPPDPKVEPRHPWRRQILTTGLAVIVTAAVMAVIFRALDDPEPADTPTTGAPTTTVATTPATIPTTTATTTLPSSAFTSAADTPTTSAATRPATTAATRPATTAVNETPGAGTSVTMARANWSTGYLQAAIYAALLAEMGYEVSDPADLELPPSNAFVAMANGEFDFWVNSWFPNHNQFLAGEMPDGSLVRDYLTTLGKEMARAGVQGLITNKAFADANGLTTLDAMLSDPEVFAVYEAADQSPGDGILQIYGCPDGWGCHVNINGWIENAGWDNIEQFDIGGYDAMIADAIAKDAAGEPYMVYTWAPSHYVSDLRPGDNAVWVSIHTDPSVSDTQIEGATSIGDQCTTDPCLLGWDAADIRVTANSNFLAANPAAARLFELVVISPVDVALQNVRMAGGDDDVEAHAAEWIANNRELVDSWLQAARLADEEA